MAGVFNLSPKPVALLSRAASAAPAGGDAVTVWNALAGVAATKACRFFAWILSKADVFRRRRGVWRRQLANVEPEVPSCMEILR